MIDERAATELKLYIDNDGDLYRGITTSILKNLATKKARGEYDSYKATKAFTYLVDAGAKKYAKEFGGTWHQLFNVPTRVQIAEELRDDFESEWNAGSYRNLLPKKYQAKSATSHARIKSSKSVKWRVPEGLAVRWAPVNNAWFALWPASAPVNKQQVLKIAGTEEMHDWLRDRYGEPYGLAARASGRSHARRRSGAQLDREIAAALSSHRGGR